MKLLTNDYLEGFLISIDFLESKIPVKKLLNKIDFDGFKYIGKIGIDDLKKESPSFFLTTESILEGNEDIKESPIEISINEEQIRISSFPMIKKAYMHFDKSVIDAQYIFSTYSSINPEAVKIKLKCNLNFRIYNETNLKIVKNQINNVKLKDISLTGLIFDKKIKGSEYSFIFLIKKEKDKEFLNLLVQKIEVIEQNLNLLDLKELYDSKINEINDFLKSIISE